MLTRPTKMMRQTLTPNARVIVAPDVDESGNPRDGFRRIRIITPTPDLCAGRQIVMGLDVDPNTLGPDMLYKLTPLAPNLPIPFDIRPEQWIIAAVSENDVTLGVIVEYHEDGDA